MGKKKADKKGKGKEKTALKTEKKAERKAKKELAKKGEVTRISDCHYNYKRILTVKIHGRVVTESVFCMCLL